VGWAILAAEGCVLDALTENRLLSVIECRGALVNVRRRVGG
jgi:hypothetical protein